MERKNNRLKWYDYSKEWLYFITICSYDRKNIFCDIINWGVLLNDLGKIVEEVWNYIPNIHQEVQLYEYIIMPNHIHWIIELSKYNTKDIWSIIKWFKFETIRRSKSICNNSLWQKSFYDHIIRTEESYKNIAYYINNNPKNRDKDSLFIK